MGHVTSLALQQLHLFRALITKASQTYVLSSSINNVDVLFFSRCRNII